MCQMNYDDDAAVGAFTLNFIFSFEISNRNFSQIMKISVGRQNNRIFSVWNERLIKKELYCIATMNLSKGLQDVVGKFSLLNIIQRHFSENQTK